MQSIFNNLDVAEYVSDGAGLVLSNGSTVYVSTETEGDPKPAPISGLEVSPNLWLGFCILANPSVSGLANLLKDFVILTSSSTLNVPFCIFISTNLGTISGIALSR